MVLLFSLKGVVRACGCWVDNFVNGIRISNKGSSSEFCILDYFSEDSGGKSSLKYYNFGVCCVFCVCLKLYVSLISIGLFYVVL